MRFTQARASLVSRPGVAAGVVGVAVVAATIGIAAAAQADQVPTPNSSDDVSYQATVPQPSAPAVQVVDASSPNDSQRPADLTPEDLQNLREQQKLFTYSPQGGQ